MSGWTGVELSAIRRFPSSQNPIGTALLKVCRNLGVVVIVDIWIYFIWVSFCNVVVGVMRSALPSLATSGRVSEITCRRAVLEILYFYLASSLNSAYVVILIAAEFIEFSKFVVVEIYASTRQGLFLCNSNAARRGNYCGRTLAKNESSLGPDSSLLE
jgi:hypothetical protein